MIKDKLNDGFFIVPGYSEYSISRLGAVLYLPTNELLSRYWDEEALVYKCHVPINAPVIKSISWLLAITFVPNTSGQLNLTYLDDNPKNIYLDNLNWGKKSKVVVVDRTNKQKRDVVTDTNLPVYNSVVKCAVLITRHGVTTLFDTLAAAAKYTDVDQGKLMDLLCTPNVIKCSIGNTEYAFA